MNQQYDVLLFPRKQCNVCGNELEIKMSIEQTNRCIKFYHTCNKCKTTACDTLKLAYRSKEEYKTPTPQTTKVKLIPPAKAGGTYRSIGE